MFVVTRNPWMVGNAEGSVYLELSLFTDKAFYAVQTIEDVDR